MSLQPHRSCRSRAEPRMGANHCPLNTITRSRKSEPDVLLKVSIPSSTTSALPPSTGLRVTANLIDRDYHKGVTYTDQQNRTLPIQHHDSLPKWN
jgi:hypothetical protein